MPISTAALRLVDAARDQDASMPTTCRRSSKLRLLLAGLLGCLGAALALAEQPNVPRELFDSFKKFQNLGRTIDGDNLNFLDYLLQEYVPPLLGQRPYNENGSRVEFKEYNLMDTSNDDAARLTGQELIARSGFKFEVFDAVADDGYITEITHLKNPLADPTKLRRPPVLMEHGGTIDPTAYLVASSIQHFPEKWPRRPEDGPMRSWNRSLAFVLANNGFDVWLAETRGSSDRNRRHIKTKALHSVLSGKNDNKNQTAAEQANEVSHQWDYWGFSLDDIIAHELKSHMDTVLRLTKSKRLHLMTFSMSTPTSLSFLGMRPDYAKRIQGYISMAPIISGEGVNKVVKLSFQTICPLMPHSVGTLIWTDTFLTQRTRDLLLMAASDRTLRYSFFKSIVGYFMGSSPKWLSLYDLNVVGHMLRSLSFKETKQLCQQTQSNRLQKFDYGPVKNKLIYNQTEPPEYDISDLKIRDWIVVTAANDLLSTPDVYQHLYDVVNPKPVAHIVAPGFNHLDLIIGWENDKYVNLPILRYLQRMSYPVSEPASNGQKDNSTNDEDAYEATASASSRSLDLTELGAPEPTRRPQVVATARQQQAGIGPLEMSEMLHALTRNLETLLAGLKVSASGFDLLNTATKTLTGGAMGANGNANFNAAPANTAAAAASPDTSKGIVSPLNPFVESLTKSVPVLGGALENLNQLMQPDKLMKSFGGPGTGAGANAIDSLNQLLQPGKLFSSYGGATGLAGGTAAATQPAAGGAVGANAGAPATIASGISAATNTLANVAPAAGVLTNSFQSLTDLFKPKPGR